MDRLPEEILNGILRHLDLPSVALLYMSNKEIKEHLESCSWVWENQLCLAVIHDSMVCPTLGFIPVVVSDNGLKPQVKFMKIKEERNNAHLGYFRSIGRFYKAACRETEYVNLIMSVRFARGTWVTIPECAMHAIMDYEDLFKKKNYRTTFVLARDYIESRVRARLILVDIYDIAVEAFFRAAASIIAIVWLVFLQAVFTTVMGAFVILVGA